MSHLEDYDHQFLELLANAFRRLAEEKSMKEQKQGTTERNKSTC